MFSFTCEAIARFLNEHPLCCSLQKTIASVSNTAGLLGRYDMANRGVGREPKEKSDDVQLLGLRGRDSYLDPQILAAYESLAAEPIEDGFSQRASDGRMLLLEEVFQDLRRSKGRGSIQSKGIDIGWNLLPGALALLQEVVPWLPAVKRLQGQGGTDMPCKPNNAECCVLPMPTQWLRLDAPAKVT